VPDDKVFFSVVVYLEQGCQIFPNPSYQDRENRRKTTKLTKIPNCHKICQKFPLHLPKCIKWGFLVWKYTIWQPCSGEQESQSTLKARQKKVALVVLSLCWLMPQTSSSCMCVCKYKTFNKNNLLNYHWRTETNLHLSHTTSCLKLHLSKWGASATSADILSEQCSWHKNKKATSVRPTISRNSWDLKGFVDKKDILHKYVGNRCSVYGKNTCIPTYMKWIWGQSYRQRLFLR
jgi:hypothetical protein